MKKLYTLFLALGIFAFSGAYAQDIDETFFNNGKALMENKEFFKAAQEFDHAIAVNPTGKYYYHKGLALRLAQKIEGAIEAYEQCILVQPDYLDAYKELVGCYMRTNNYDKLIATWDGIAKNISDTQERLDAKFKIVNFLMKQRDYETALGHAKDAIKIAPNNIDALHLYAKVNNTIGNYEEAKTSAQKAADQLATSDIKVVSKVYYELGYAAHFLGDFDIKNAAFENVREPSFKPLMAKLTPEFFTNMAEAYDAIFEYDNAQVYLDEALRIDEHFPSANKLQAVITGHKNPKHEMIAYYKKAITGILKKKETNNTDEYDQQLLEDYEHLIELKINSKEYEPAIAMADECLEIFAQQPLAINSVKFFKAIALNKTGKMDEAISILIEMGDPSNRTANAVKVSQYNFAIGNMYYSAKEFDKAKSYFTRARSGPFANAAQYMFEEILDMQNPRNATATNSAEEE